MTAHHAELGAFLRARRAALTPGDVGLPDRIGRRRTAGLRREEVATLADVSASWYTWLEQGRAVHPSVEVLAALARALRLTDAERRHLFELAGRTTASTPTPDALPPGALDRIGRLLDLLAPAPAFAWTAARDIVAWNLPMVRLLPELAAWSPERRNLLWMMWQEPAVAALVADAEGDARRLVAELRADPATRDDEGAAAMVERLCGASSGFAACWAGHDVVDPAPRVRRFRHRWAGELRFETQELTPAGHAGLRITVHLPLEGDDSTDRLLAWPTLP